MQMELDRTFLLQALELAAKRRGFTAPNPAVGAVVVKNNQVIASGFHQQAGNPHAEVLALEKLTLDERRQATIYVTLEPCCHYGRTPPCTDLIIQSGLKRVVYAHCDPNPLVLGQGEAQLKAHGIEVSTVFIPEIAKFYQAYDFWTQRKLPWVNTKIALSLDGKIAAAGGRPVAITGSDLNAFTQQQRKIADAIFTTVKTVIRDNPRFNARVGQEIFAKAVYVLDRQLQFPPTAQLLQTAKNITLFHDRSADAKNLAQFQALGLRCLAIDSQHNQLDLAAVMAVIGQDGMHQLWSETGGQCFYALHAAGLVKKTFIYIAPKILGETAYGGLRLSETMLARANAVQWQSFGQDVVCELEW